MFILQFPGLSARYGVASSDQHGVNNLPNWAKYSSIYLHRQVYILVQTGSISCRRPHPLHLQVDVEALAGGRRGRHAPEYNLSFITANQSIRYTAARPIELTPYFLGSAYHSVSHISSLVPPRLSLPTNENIQSLRRQLRIESSVLPLYFFSSLLAILFPTARCPINKPPVLPS